MLQSYIWVLITPASGLIILVSAIDRFISVMFPIQHMKISINYSYVMISLPILLSSPYLIIGGIQSYERKDIYNVTDNKIRKLNEHKNLDTADMQFSEWRYATNFL